MGEAKSPPDTLFPRQNHNPDVLSCLANLSKQSGSKALKGFATTLFHSEKPREIFGDMKFDVIIGNPPYQLDTGGGAKQATPLYNKFIEQAETLNPEYICFIIPSRWYNGGMGLDKFRAKMINDDRIMVLIDFINARDCFPQNSVSGGVCSFLWKKNYHGECNIINKYGKSSSSYTRRLNEFNVFVRYNNAIPILRKIVNERFKNIQDLVSSLMPYGLPSTIRGNQLKENDTDLTLYASNGITYIDAKTINKGRDTIYKYKVLISKTSAEHAGEPDNSGKYKVLTSAIRVIGHKEICTHSYFIIGSFDNKEDADNLLTYLKTKFVRFLILMGLSSINISKFSFEFVPLQDFSKPWTDAELYAKYGLSQEEIDYIDATIKPMDSEVD